MLILDIVIEQGHMSRYIISGGYNAENFPCKKSVNFIYNCKIIEQ